MSHHYSLKHHPKHLEHDEKQGSALLDGATYDKNLETVCIQIVRTWIKQYIIYFYCCLTMSVFQESTMKFIRISFSQKDAAEQNYLIA